MHFILIKLAFLLLKIAFGTCTEYRNTYLEISMSMLEQRNVRVLVTSNNLEHPVFQASGNVSTAFTTTYRFLISFDQKYTIFITPINELDPNAVNTELRLRLPSKRFFFIPETVMPPLKGLSIRVGCRSPWYGDDCNVLCDNVVAQIEQKLCHETGGYRCAHGHMGPNCTEVLDTSSCNCQNKGFCLYTFKSLLGELSCACPDGFSGNNCEVFTEKTVEMSFYSVDKNGNEKIKKDAAFKGKMLKNQFGKPAGKGLVVGPEV